MFEIGLYWQESSYSLLDNGVIMIYRSLLLTLIYITCAFRVTYAQTTNDAFKFEKGSVLTHFSLAISGAERDDGFNAQFEREFNLGIYELDTHYMLTNHIGVGLVLNYQRRSNTFDNSFNESESQTVIRNFFTYGIQIGYFSEVRINDWEPIYAYGNISVSRMRFRGRADNEISPDVQGEPSFTPMYDLSVGIIKPISKRIALQLELERFAEREEFFVSVGAGSSQRTIRTTEWPVRISLSAGLSLALF